MNCNLEIAKLFGAEFIELILGCSCACTNPTSGAIGSHIPMFQAAHVKSIHLRRWSRSSANRCCRSDAAVPFQGRETAAAPTSKCVQTHTYTYTGHWGRACERRKQLRMDEEGGGGIAAKAVMLQHKNAVDERENLREKFGHNVVAKA
jgi:hypothetical protein